MQSLYSQVVPGDWWKGSLSPPLIDVSEWWEMLGQHFDSRRWEMIFQSFCDEFQEDDLTFSKLSTVQDVYFKVEALNYLGTVKSRVSGLPGVGRVHTITIKLPNNNNTTEDHEATFGPRLIKDRHNGTLGWVRLAFSPCPIIDVWAQVCLGTQDAHPIYMYNFPLHRLDIKFYSESKQISVTFEPGYPETPFWNEWVEKEAT